jgi:hypothetical protein
MRVLESGQGRGHALARSPTWIFLRFNSSRENLGRCCFSTSFAWNSRISLACLS